MGRRLYVLGVVWCCSISGCTAGSYGGGTMGCELRPDSPHVSAGYFKKTGLKNVAGKVDFHCRVLVTSHEITVRLEKQSGSEWIEMATDSDDRIPPAGGKDLTTQVAYPGCTSGTWRTLATAVTLYQGQSTTSPLFRSLTSGIDCDRVP